MEYIYIYIYIYVWNQHGAVTTWVVWANSQFANVGFLSVCFSLFRKGGLNKRFPEKASKNKNVLSVQLFMLLR